MRFISIVGTLLLAGSLGLGCGGSGATPTDAARDEQPIPSATALLPWGVGNRWVYKVTEDGEVSQKETVVGELEAVGGTGPNRDVQAHRVTTSKSSGAKTVSWQKVVDARLVRYREQSLRASDGAVKDEQVWEPPKLHVDETAEHAVVGATWLESSEETNLKDGKTTAATVRDRWTVVAEAESVTVPAGTFQAVVLQKAGSGTPKTYWFVRGIGKVKETGGQTEELVSYDIPSR